MATGQSDPFVVPAGYVALIRQFKFSADPVLDIGCDEVLTSILIDDIPQANYEDLPLGPEAVDFLPCYILADNGQRIALRVVNVNDPAAAVDVCFVFHGNLLLRTGVPIEYQPGNMTKTEAMGPGFPNPIEKDFITRSPRAGGTVARRRTRRAPTRVRRMSRAEQRTAAIAARRRGRR